MTSAPRHPQGGERLARRAQVLAAIGLTGIAWAFAGGPRVPLAERNELALRFSFERHELWSGGDEPHRSVRDVHPRLEHIAAWVSSVGAGIALCDLDGDGTANDVVHVDPRSNAVLVSCAPTTPSRFHPFRLDLVGAGVDAPTQAPMGCMPADLNEDGHLDLCVYFWGRPPIAFLRRGATLDSAAFISCPIGDPYERWYTNALTQADVDGDGHPDLVIGNYFPDGARVLDTRAEGSESMQHSMSRAENGGRNRILAWRGASSAEVRFSELEHVLDPASARRWTLAIAALDLDGDQRPEIYFANDFGPDELLWNQSGNGIVSLRAVHGKRDWRTPSSKVLGRDSFKGMGVDLADLDGDGGFDIWVSNITEPYALEESQLLFLSQPGASERPRTAPFRDASEALGFSRTGWAWDVKFADFDGDGVLEGLQATGFVKGRRNRWPELQELATGNDELLAHPRSWPRFAAGDDVSGRDANAFFARSAGGRFVDIAAQLGLDDRAVARGIAVGDIDGDADLDFAIANQWESSTLHVNSADGGRSLSIDLRVALRPGSTWIGSEYALAPPSRAAIGAVARLKRPGASPRISYVDGGNGHSGFRSPHVHFGVGLGEPHERFDLEVEWRDPQGVRRADAFQVSSGTTIIVLGWTQAEEQS